MRKSSRKQKPPRRISQAVVNIYCPHGCQIPIGLPPGYHCKTHDCPKKEEPKVTFKPAVCAYRGDHTASGQVATSVTLPGGYLGGLQVWILLAFCGEHDPDISQYPEGTHFHGEIQIGLKKSDDLASNVQPLRPDVIEGRLQ